MGASFHHGRQKANLYHLSPTFHTFGNTSPSCTRTTTPLPSTIGKGSSPILFIYLFIYFLIGVSLSKFDPTGEATTPFQNYTFHLSFKNLHWDFERFGFNFKPTLTIFHQPLYKDIIYICMQMIKTKEKNTQRNEKLPWKFQLVAQRAYSNQFHQHISSVPYTQPLHCYI